MEQEFQMLIFCLLPMLVGVVVGAILSRWPKTMRMSHIRKERISITASIIVWLFLFSLFLWLNPTVHFPGGNQIDENESGTFNNS